MPDRNYLASALRSQRERGTQHDEDWYRLKVTGMGETVWINVSPETLDAIIAAVAEPGIVEAARELLDICDWPRRYDQEDYDRAVSALRDATPPKPAPPIDYDPAIHPF